MSLLFGADLLSFSGAELQKSAKIANSDRRPRRNSSTQYSRQLTSSLSSCRNTYSLFYWSTASMFRSKNYPGVSTTAGQGRASLTEISIWGSFCRFESISRFAINCATVRDGDDRRERSGRLSGSMIDWFRRRTAFSRDAASYRVNPPIPAGSGHAMNGCSESISDRPVIRQLARGIADPTG
jgi:hypothetical protein